MKAAAQSAVCCLVVLVSVAIGCSPSKDKAAPGLKPAADQAGESSVPVFHVDPATAGSVSGTISYKGKRPAHKLIDMSEDPACVEAHHGKAQDESLVFGANGGLANAFIYVKAGLEGKRFETPVTPVAIDQNGCWFTPRVLGIQTNQQLKVTNSDPVTHNIHPMAQINREWNHSQGAGDAPLARKFIKPEVMIRVKCNIHSWMHAYIGVVDSPYFAVSKEDGSFRIPNLPPGSYTLGVWQESLGTRELQVTVAPQSNTLANLTFKGQ